MCNLSHKYKGRDHHFFKTVEEFKSDGLYTIHRSQYEEFDMVNNTIEDEQ